MRGVIALLLLALVAAFAGGCRDRIPASPTEAATLALASLRKGEPRPVFHALPESWQQEVQSLYVCFVDGVDPETWNAVAAGMGHLVDGIRRHPEEALSLPLPIRNEGDRIRVLQILVALWDALEDAGVGRHETARKLIVDHFLKDPGPEVMSLLLDLAERTRPRASWRVLHGAFAGLAVVRRDAEGVTFDEAAPVANGDVILRVRLGDKDHEVPFIRVEGRCVPKALAAGWGPALVRAHAILEAGSVRWTENREALRLRAEAFQAAAAVFARSGAFDALITTLPAL